MKDNYVIIDKVYLKKYDIEVRFTHNVYHAFCNLNDYLDFIKQLVENTRNIYQNYGMRDEEFKIFLYYMFIYFLLHWDNISYSIQTQWCSWINFKVNINKYLKENDVVILDRIRNIEVYEKYIQKNFNNKVKTDNKNKPWSIFLKNYNGQVIYLYFLIRTIIKNFIRKTPSLNNKICLMMTDYDRYYFSKGFFSEELFNNKKFNEIIQSSSNIEINKENCTVIYTKYNYGGLFDYINSLKEDNKSLFIEDILHPKLGKKLLITSIRNNLLSNLNNISHYDDNSEFLLEMYKDFLRNKVPYVIWIYLSLKEFFNKNKNIHLAIGDSEKNFLFYILNLFKKIENNNLKTLAFSHEVITEQGYFYIPLSNKYDDTPDCKFVWNEGVKNLMITKYNYPPNKIVECPDPRFLKWKSKKFKKNTILIVSQGYVEFYNELLSILTNSSIINDLINMGIHIYLKPHPAEYLNNENIKHFDTIRLKFIHKISIIDDLNFMPEYAIGKDSTLLYELYLNKTNVYFISANNLFMIDEAIYKNINKSSIYDALLDIKHNIKINDP
jgi:hypothetical protein